MLKPVEGYTTFVFPEEKDSLLRTESLTTNRLLRDCSRKLVVGGESQSRLGANPKVDSTCPCFWKPQVATPVRTPVFGGLSTWM